MMASNTRPTANPLPPMPKLRPRPGLKPPSRLLANTTTQEHELPTMPQALEDSAKEVSLGSGDLKQPPIPSYSVPQFNIVVPSSGASPDFPEMTITVSACRQEQPDVPEKTTSRLLTKNEVKGGRGGRKRNGDGSLIHSIPKFSQVVPKSGQISDVQKVLQSRLLSRQKAKQQQQQQQEQTTASSDAKRAKAASLQSFIQSLHHQKMVMTPKSHPASAAPKEPPATSVAFNDNNRRKSRKPKKDEICHVLHQDPVSHDGQKGHPEVSDTSVPAAANTINIQTPPPMTKPKPPPPPQTTTSAPASATTASAAAPPQPRISPPPSMLTPEEYERLGLPTGYIFWPTANVFIHTTTMFTSLMPISPQTSQNDATQSAAPAAPAAATSTHLIQCASSALQGETPGPPVNKMSKKMTKSQKKKELAAKNASLVWGVTQRL